MDETKRDPIEDIFLIRQVLERATSGMRSLAPWFIRFGLVWLLYGGFSAAYRIFIHFVSMPETGHLAILSAVVGWIFYLTLAGGFLVCRNRQAELGLDTTARKFVDMWGVCILTFLILMILLSVVIPFLVLRTAAASAGTADAIGKACSLCKGFLFYLLPASPLLITALFLENRRMLLTGILLMVLTAAILCIHALMLFGNDAVSVVEWHFFWIGATCLMDLLPGLMLLIFGRQLKER